MVLDVETTGLKPEEDRILEMTIAEFPHGVHGLHSVVYDWSFKVDRESEPGAYAVHGIASSDQADCPEFKDMACEVAALFAGKPPVVVGHGVAFDMAFLNAEFKRIGMVPPLYNGMLDTKQGARAYLSDGDLRASLDRCLELFGIGGRKCEHHESHEDVELTSKLLYKLMMAARYGFDEAVKDDVYPASFGCFNRYYGEDEPVFSVDELSDAAGMALKEMEELIGSRDGESGSHGSFESNADISQDIKDIYRKHPGFEKLTKAEREALDNIAIKQSRIISTALSEDYDSWVDVMGYGFLGRRYRMRRHGDGE